MAGSPRLTTIGDLLAEGGGSIKTGPFGTTLKAKDYSTEGVPLISVGEVAYGSLRVHARTPRVPREVVERLPEYLLEAGDIVFGRKGAVDRSALVKPDQAGWFLGSDGIRLRLPPTVDARFIAYQLLGFASRSWLLQHATGTTMASLNQSTIERIPILLPALPEQRAIAHILGTLDDKIELNRRMNETLEEMARALFKSWFVDFDPVRRKAEGRDPGLPKHLADLFPSRVVDSELGEIPEGWRPSMWGDLVTLEYGRALREYKDAPGAVPVFGTNGPIGFHTHPLCAHAGIVVGRKGAYRGIHFSDRPFYVIDTAFYMEARVPISWRWAHYELLRFDLNALDSGSAIPSTSRDQFYRISVCQPPHSIQQAFEDQLADYWQRGQCGQGESNQLGSIRDALLPKLISGELRVKDAQRIVEVSS